jgi:hypothetical protein
MQRLNIDIFDDGDLAAFTTKFQNALVSLQPRLVLTSPTNFYVATTGSDGNDGLTPSSAWRTLQYTANYLEAELDANNQDIVINIERGNYVGFMMGPILGAESSNVYFRGVVGDASAVTITDEPEQDTDDCVIAYRSSLQLEWVRLVNSGTGGHALRGTTNAVLHFANCDFGPVANGAHIASDLASFCRAYGPYRISGGATSHIWCGDGSVYGHVTLNSPVTIVNTPDFPGGFVHLQDGSLAVLDPNTSWSGLATGRRFAVDTCSVLRTNRAGQPGVAADWLPGDQPGVADAATYGVFVP